MMTREFIKDTEELAKIMNKMEKLAAGSTEWLKLSAKASRLLIKHGAVEAE